MSVPPYPPPVARPVARPREVNIAFALYLLLALAAIAGAAISLPTVPDLIRQSFRQSAGRTPGLDPRCSMRWSDPWSGSARSS
jgi:hypothetical protein